MITFLNTNKDTIILKVITSELTKQIAAINGADISNVDEIIKYIKNNDINHILLTVSYYEDEKKLLDLINTNNGNFNGNIISKLDGNKDEKTENKSSRDKQDNKKDFVCPKCGSNEGLVDKDGNKYPCISCLQIDLGQKIIGKMAKEFSGVINKNNLLIDELVNIFSRPVNNQEKTDQEK